MNSVSCFWFGMFGLTDVALITGILMTDVTRITSEDTEALSD